MRWRWPRGPLLADRPQGWYGWLFNEIVEAMPLLAADAGPACSRRCGRASGQAARSSRRRTSGFGTRYCARSRSAAAVAQAREEIDGLLAAGRPEDVRALQRAVRDTMTEHAGVVATKKGCVRVSRNST